MSVNQITPVNNNINSNGQGNKANGIVQTQQPQQSGAWILADNGVLYMNGLITPSGGGLFQIIAPDASSNVTCVNNGAIYVNADNIFVNGVIYGLTIANGSQITNDGGASTINFNNGVMVQSAEQQLNIQTPDLQVNGNPSSEQTICYGEAKAGTNTADFHDTITYANPDITQPDINIEIWRLPDFNQWFDYQNYNRPDNHILRAEADGFRWNDLGHNMIEIEINWQLYYTFDGSYPTTQLCCGLFDRDANIIVPQSIRWLPLNDIKFKYVTMYTNFTMKTDEDHLYIPFFMNSNHGQLQVYDFGGNSRCWIKFKKYQFVTY